MTTLIAFKIKNGVIITADTRTSKVNENGENLGYLKDSKKITTVAYNMLMATGGLGKVGKYTTKLLESALSLNKNLSVTESLTFIKNTLRSSHDLFTSVNPDRYNDMFAIVGGYDFEEDKPYIYVLTNTIENFEPQEIKSDLCVLGVGSDEIRSNITAKLGDCKTPQDLIELFSSSIRNIDSEDISKDTFSTLIFKKSNEDHCRAAKFTVDKDGNLTQIK